MKYDFFLNINLVFHYIIKQYYKQVFLEPTAMIQIKTVEEGIAIHLIYTLIHLQAIKSP